MEVSNATYKRLKDESTETKLHKWIWRGCLFFSFLCQFGFNFSFTVDYNISEITCQALLDFYSALDENSWTFRDHHNACYKLTSENIGCQKQQVQCHLQYMPRWPTTTFDNLSQLFQNENESFYYKSLPFLFSMLSLFFIFVIIVTFCFNQSLCLIRSQVFSIFLYCGCYVTTVIITFDIASETFPVVTATLAHHQNVPHVEEIRRLWFGFYILCFGLCLSFLSLSLILLLMWEMKRSARSEQSTELSKESDSFDPLQKYETKKELKEETKHEPIILGTRPQLFKNQVGSPPAGSLLPSRKRSSQPICKSAYRIKRRSTAGNESVLTQRGLGWTDADSDLGDTNSTQYMQVPAFEPNTPKLFLGRKFKGKKESMFKSPNLREPRTYSTEKPPGPNTYSAEKPPGPIKFSAEKPIFHNFS